jgi:hypothetical protein
MGAVSVTHTTQILFFLGVFGCLIFCAGYGWCAGDSVLGCVFIVVLRLRVGGVLAFLCLAVYLQLRAGEDD